MYTSFDQWFNTNNILNNEKLTEHKALFEDCWNNVESLYKEKVSQLEDEVDNLECDLGDMSYLEEGLNELQDWKTEVITFLKTVLNNEENEKKLIELIDEGERL